MGADLPAIIRRLVIGNSKQWKTDGLRSAGLAITARKNALIKRTPPHQPNKDKMKTKEQIYNRRLAESGLSKEEMNSHTLYPIVMATIDECLKQQHSSVPEQKKKLSEITDLDKALIGGMYFEREGTPHDGDFVLTWIMKEKGHNINYQKAIQIHCYLTGRGYELPVYYK